MSPRPPPKISLKHEWTRELGSKGARQPEGEVAPQAKIFQPTQPNPNPILMQDGRKTSHSQEIDVNSFQEELSSSDRTGRPFETEVIQTRSSEDRKDFNVEHTRERTGLPVNTHDVTNVLLIKAKRSKLKTKNFVKERKDPLLIMTWVMTQWWWTRRTWTSESQDYHIPLWNTRKVPAFENWFWKSRTIQIDMLLNKIYDRINHLILSVQNQNKWFGMLGTSNYVNCSKRNPKRSAKYVYHTGIKKDFKGIHNRFLWDPDVRKSMLEHDRSFTPRVRHQERTTSWTSIWEKARRQRILSG